MHTKWIWTPINFQPEKSANKPEIPHWIQKNNKNKVFHFSKFDMPLIIPEFTDQEYDEHLANLEPKWSKEEVFYLWGLLKAYQMRFFVVFDRYDQEKYPRSLDELKNKFFTINNKLAQVKGLKKSPYYNFQFNYAHEKLRKYQLEKYILRSKSKHLQEKQLEDQLKKLDVQIKRKEKEEANLKKLIEVGIDKLDIPDVDKLIQSKELKQHSLFQYSEKCAYLRGSVMHGPFPNLSIKLNKKIEDVMGELSIPEKPMPTKLIHAKYDQLRKSILKMFSLQIHLKNKEAEKKRLGDKIEKTKREKERPKDSLGKRHPMMIDGDKVKKRLKN